jgi:hypothetical protein
MALDLLLSDENELQFVNGDFLFGDSGDDDLSLLLSHTPGSFRAHPIAGANLYRLIRAVNSGISDVIGAEVSEPLKRDGFTSWSIDFKGSSGPSIKAKR